MKNLDAPRVRQSDISFALTVVLHALSPPSAQQPNRVVAAKNISSSGGGTGTVGAVGSGASGGTGIGGSGDGSRGGSLSVHSGGGTHPQQQQQRSGGGGSINNRTTLLQVAFLGMKILMTCFNHQLSLDWPRVARCIREIAERRGDERNSAFWNFLIFVATQRGPLFPLILPLMWNKVPPVPPKLVSLVS